jgi:glutamate racemase
MERDSPSTPNENHIPCRQYAPYGQKSKRRDCSLSIKNTDLLLEMNCKLIVVACNTATNAIRELRAKYDIPLLV